MMAPGAARANDSDGLRVRLAARPVEARRGAAGIAHRAKQGRARAHGVEPECSLTAGELTSGAFAVAEAPPTARLVLLADLGLHECAWPVDGHGARARFCGRPIDPEAAGTLRERYCRHHGPRASTPAPVTRPFKLPRGARW